jgi:hypothetical protein
LKERRPLPAPLAALDVVHRRLRARRRAAARGGAALRRLAVTDVSRELVFLFFATPRSRRTGLAAACAAGAAARPCSAAASWAGIAALRPRRHAVRLKDADHARVAAAETVRVQLGEAVTRKRATAAEVAAQRALVTARATTPGCDAPTS